MRIPKCAGGAQGRGLAIPGLERQRSLGACLVVGEESK